MKRLYFLIIAVVVTVTSSFSQATNCTQVLRLARTTYEQGRLHELPALVEGCLKASGETGFTPEQKRETYRLLTLAYIYLEEPEKADESMLELLRTDHFYQVNNSVDPAEFIALFNKYRTRPLFRIGVKIGANLTQPTVLNYYNVGSAAGGQGKYGLKLGFNFIAIFEKDLSTKTTGLLSRLVFAPELGYIIRNFSYTNSKLINGDAGNLVSTQNLDIGQSWLDVNPILQYKFKNTVDLQTYIGLGPSLNYLLSSSVQPNTLLGNSYTVTGPAVSDLKAYNQLMYSIIITAGFKKKLGELYLTVDARYQYGFGNAVNGGSRSIPELVYDYQTQYNDYRINNFSINIGVIYPYFKPKKLIK
ncbi:MAG: PorT family protein [Cyclobacteriaceae bacterium]|nr:PorT family protein [Cyclobacteriaceae bacterium]